MPVDIKLIRSKPSVVQEWQNLRQGRERRHNNDQQQSNETSNSPRDEIENDTVQTVVSLDAHCRHLLHQLTIQRTKLNEIKKSLRPIKTSEAAQQQKEQQQEEVKAKQEEIGTLQTCIAKLQNDWKVATQQVEQALCKVASPVDLQVHRILPQQQELQQQQTYAMDTTLSTRAWPKAMSNGALCLTSNVGLDIAQAFFLYTRHYFRQFAMIRLPESIPIDNPMDDTNPAHHKSQNDKNAYDYRIDTNLVDAICGCSNITGSRSPMVGNATTSAPKSDNSNVDDESLLTKDPCASSSTTNPEQHPTTANAELQLASWLAVVAHQQQPNNQPKKKKQNSTNSVASKKTIIYGAKQLPRYTGLWTLPNPSSLTTSKNYVVVGGGAGNDGNPPSNLETFQIIALTPGTIWDSRSIQGKLLQQMIDFYSTFEILSPKTTDNQLSAESLREEEDSIRTCGDAATAIPSSFRTRVVEPTQLERHELSRIVVEATIMGSVNSDENNTSNNDTTIAIKIGSISNFGDSASRACGLQCVGGGGGHATNKTRGTNGNSMTNNKKKKSSSSSPGKDYVHVVQATICHEGTLRWFLSHNTQPHHRLQRTRTNKIADNKIPWMVGIPEEIANFMVAKRNGKDESNNVWIPLEEFVRSDGCSHQLTLLHEELYREQPEANQLLHVATKDENRRGDASSGYYKPKFPPLAVMPQPQEQANLEQLACPYDFLFGWEDDKCN